jgi:aminoglycoside/choline kinase family phosphotransferase
MTTRRVYERSATNVRRSAYHTDWLKPEASAKQRRIFEAVWNELRPDALLQEREDALRDEITRRVAMYSESGLKESNRIANAVLHSFGRVAG